MVDKDNSTLLATQVNDIQQWFDSELGGELLDAQKRAINRLLPNLFGYHLVEVAINPNMALCDQSLIGHKVIISEQHQLGLCDRSVLCLATELPFEQNSVDVVLLHHSLDFTENPHQVLREAIRVLRPGGHLLVVGFNPSSWWGLQRVCKRKACTPWSQGQFISQSRLADWMSLLGLTQLRLITDYYLPPIKSRKWRARFEKFQAYGRRSLPKNGAFTVTLARKDVEGMTPVKHIKFSRKFYTLPVRKPATRDLIRERS
ncbi:MAG: class I SAM-dependent methyltransferase [Oceanospirillaceae bacterium]|nr:class I SAM-dependent methyltransferase [Oceanospirillaceae bacterium]